MPSESLQGWRIATIDAQAATITELRGQIEGYRQALEVLTDGEKWWDWLSAGIPEDTIKGIYELIGKSTADPRSERVLAGKEANGGDAATIR